VRKPRVILADEQLMFSAMAAQLLRPEFEVVTVVHDGRALIAAADEWEQMAAYDTLIDAADRRR